MKRELTTLANGSITLTPHPHFTPPLGLCLPAGQDTSAAPPTSRTLGSLFSDASPAIPAGMQLIAGSSVYVFNGTYWMDSSTYTDASAVSISGTVLIRNNAAHDIGVTW